MPRRGEDPFASFNFLLEIDGLARAGFSEVTGINNEQAVIEYREGTETLTPRKLPGLTKFGNVTLKRGVTNDPELMNWRKTVTDGDIFRANVSIVLLNEARQEAVRWNLVNAWPCKWTGPDLKANASEMAIEAIEVCHEGITRQ